ncbi:MAG: EpsI family protein [Acidobacteria bacterium]|nr:EpsI family protein [Acidobacteriota bacterium]
MKKRIIILSVTLLAAAAVIARASRPEVVPLRASLSNLPMQVGEWEGREAPEMQEQVLQVLGVDDYIYRIYYTQELYPASLYVGYYESQRQGDTIHSPMNCLPGAGWNPAENDRIVVPIEGRSPIEINRIVIQKGTDRRLVLYWYQSHGRVIASEYWGKIYTVLDALRTNRTDAALVRVILPIMGMDSEATRTSEALGVGFVQQLFPLLTEFLPN